MECERCVSVDRTLKDTYVQTAFDSEHPVNVTSITVQIMPKPKDIASAGLHNLTCSTRI